MAATTLVRFVTVRNPRKPTKGELETGFAFYDKSLEAPLITRVAQASSLEEKRRAIARFIKSKDYIPSPTDLAEIAGPLVEWGDWLTNRGALLMMEDFEARLVDHPIEGSNKLQAKLWDNLLAYTYGGGRPEVREEIIAALRTLNLRRVSDELAGDEAALRRLAGATVVLPGEASIHTALDDEGASPPDEPPPDPGKDERERIQAAWREVAMYQQAHEELSHSYMDEIQQARSMDAPPPPVPRGGGECGMQFPEHGAGAPSLKIGLIGERRKRLSKDTQVVLQKLAIGDEARVPYVLERMQAASRKVAADIARDPRAGRTVVQVGGAFWMPASTPAHAVDASKPSRLVIKRQDLEYHGFFPHAEFDPSDPEPKVECQIKPLGIADYRRVEQEIWCYEPGEVAHIENVMLGESKERVTRVLRRSEQTFTVATEEETTKEKDTQTTDRFELEKESEKVTQEDIKFDLGVNVQGSYGVVKVTADAKFAYAHSTKESDKAASTYAKEVVDKALDRVIKRVREEQVTKLLEEYEETNTHKLQAPADVHAVGLYRWVNKIYQAKVVNYGKRLMVEFLVPEPGAFHLFATIKEPVESGVPIEKPVDPRSDETITAYNVPAPLKNADSVDLDNYALWAAIYGAKVEPPPPEELTVAKAYHREGMDHKEQFADSKNDLKVPEGYQASSTFFTFGLHSQTHDGGPNWVTIAVGRCSRFATSGDSAWYPLAGEDDFVPVTIMGRTKFYATNIEVTCGRTDEALKAWKIKTFNSILQAYDERFAAYQTAFAEAKASAGVEISGTNPLRNREIEMLELKKAAIRLMTKCADVSSNAMKDADPNDPCSVPEFDCCDAIRDGSFVQFVEQAFEWSLMSYLFYPYFWGRRCNWKQIYVLDDADPLFLNFLQAGYARVIVPVRLNYETAVMRFLADGTTWNGGSAPGVDSDMYLSLENEMKEPVGEIDPEVEPWFVTVPTTLTVLQCESGCVEGEGLPCPGGPHA